jgi:hypothetical protein
MGGAQAKGSSQLYSCNICVCVTAHCVSKETLAAVAAAAV